MGRAARMSIVLLAGGALHASTGVAAAPAGPEVIVVPPSPTADGGPTSATSIDGETRTVITVSGVITETDSDGTVRRYDPLYQFGDGAPQCCNMLKASMPGSFGFNGIMYYGAPLDPKNPTYKQNPAYRDDHTYRILFNASERGQMTFIAPPGGTYAGMKTSGSFTVKIDQAAKEPVYEVAFRARQRGEPHVNGPDSAQLAAVETTGSGRLFFKRRPKAAATASGAGSFMHSDDFIGVNLEQYGADVRLVVYHYGSGAATYRSAHGRRVITVPVRVTKVTQNGDHAGDAALAEGNTGTLRIVDDKQGDDELELHMTTTTGEGHDHRSYSAGKDRVKVTIGQPHKAAG
ncbi:MAG: hypothetical protein QOG68_483 [Solirubrobacteraceae bacterium]|nr:hypothetical protein [Solirubrobacteraceae bacterium]